MTKENFTSCIEKLKKDDASESLRNSFTRLYELFSSGEIGDIPEESLLAVKNLPDSEKIASNLDLGKEALSRVALIKLNGGLGTSMGLDRAKSLLPVKNGKSFLELIVSQVVSFRKKYNCNIPLLLMNSFRTEKDSLEALSGEEEFFSGQKEIDISFIQNRIPKISEFSLGPVEYGKDPELEWCPPGHGDIYTALLQSGTLDKLIAEGYRYAFVSNADNLGASLDLEILGHFVSSGSPFMMEVADRTESDKKGGHLATDRASGKLVLREVAQCPEEDLEEFQNTGKHKYFNTNSLWLDLKALKEKLTEYEGFLPLPLIVNKKTVDPANSASEKVIQLETAMGAAIGIFQNASALRVPRSRFVPVKKTNDLLMLWSDIYELNESSEIIKSACCKERDIYIELDSEHYKSIDGFTKRFPRGAPSLKECERLSVEGDVVFGASVVCKGKVEISCKTENCSIPDGTVVDSKFRLNPSSG